MEFIVIWLLFCGLVGFIAHNKGRSGVGWFLLAFLISPLIAGIAVLVVGPGRAAVPAPGVPGVPANIGDELSKFAALRDSGAITGDEFETQKARLLALTAAPPGPRPVGSTCGKCGKPLSPAWTTNCKHCRATFAEYPPVLPVTT